MDTNGHEWLWQGGGTTKDTGSRRTTNGHEWTRMAMGRGEEEPRNTREAKEPLMDTNGHEWLWTGEGRFSTLWRLRPVDFQAELEKHDRERAGRGISLQ
mgnify:CR=1 FL=1